MFLQIRTKIRDDQDILWHVRGFIDNCVIIRTWKVKQQGWLYDIAPRHYINDCYYTGKIKNKENHRCTRI